MAPKPVVWMGNSREVLRDFPALVRDEVGFALYRAQVGSKHASALHAFQKKSTKGIATPARELDLVKARLKQAEALQRKRENQ